MSSLDCATRHQNEAAVEPDPRRSEPRMDEQGRQRVAADGGDAGGASEHARTGDPLRQHREEKMGGELCLHGVLCLRDGAGLLGGVGLPNVVRRKARSFHRKAERGPGPRLSPEASFSRVLSQCNYDLLPVCVRGHHTDSDSGCIAWEDELPGVDVIRAAMAYFLLHCGRLQSMVPRRMAGEARNNRLLRRLCNPPLFWCRRLHCCLLGNTVDIDFDISSVWLVT